MPIPLETERLVIRRFQDADLDPFYSYRNDTDVAKYQNWSIPFPREEAKERIKEMKSVAPGAPGVMCQLAVELQATCEMVGDVAFWLDKREPRRATIGCTLARAYWRQGLALEAVSRLLDYLFTEHNIHRVVADCDPDNTASFRLLERLGFRREGHFVESFWLGDHWGDEYYYGILEREWKK